MSKKFLYLFKERHDAFGGDQTTMKITLGVKGAGLAEMTHAGMPVPQGFTITTEACTQYYADNREINDEIKADIFKYMGILEEQTGKTFGSIENPLLVSVRSGARQSMPGMMDTILNLGLNDQAVEGLAKKTNNPRFAYDCYRRFIQMYSDVVMELGKSFFEERIDAMKERKGVKQDVELDANDLKELVKEFKQIYLEKQGEQFPQDPHQKATPEQCRCQPDEQKGCIQPGDTSQRPGAQQLISRKRTAGPKQKFPPQRKTEQPRQRQKRQQEAAPPGASAFSK